MLCEVDLDLQRVENAEFNAARLREINTNTYPSFSKYLDTRSSSKRTRINNIISYLAANDRRSMRINPADQKAFTCIPYRALNKAYKGSPGTYSAAFNFMLLAGMIEKYDPSRTQNRGSSWLAQSANEYAAKQKNVRAAIYYHMPKWNKGILAEAEKLASDPRRLRTLLNVIDTVGLEAAQELYDTDRRIKNSVAEARALADSILKKKLEEKGYTTRRELEKELRHTRRKCLKEVRIKKLIEEYTRPMCEAYNLVYSRPTAQQIERWNLKNRNGRPRYEWIIAVRREQSDQRAALTSPGQ